MPERFIYICVFRSVLRRGGFDFRSFFNRCIIYTCVCEGIFSADKRENRLSREWRMVALSTEVLNEDHNPVELVHGIMDNTICKSIISFRFLYFLYLVASLNWIFSTLENF